jgi:DNA polymerase-3 subunit delta'
MPEARELREMFASAVKEKRLPHAVLIEGEKGTGRTELAVWLCQALLCEKKDGFPCGNCVLCKKIASGNHPDVEVVRGGGGARSFHIEEVRDIRESVWLSPSEAEERIFVLLEIGEMGVEAQNALLKTLEEPPRHARFVMTCENRFALCETIVSRSSVYTLEAPAPAECEALLRERFPAEKPEDLALAAAVFGGNFGAASEALSTPDGMLLPRLAANTPSMLREGNAYGLLAELSASARTRETFDLYLRRLSEWVGRAAVSGAKGGRPPVGQKVTPAEALRAEELISRAREDLWQNCGVDLLQSWFCAGMAQIFGGNI